jgi:hypothetical protein
MRATKGQVDGVSVGSRAAEEEKVGSKLWLEIPELVRIPEQDTVRRGPFEDGVSTIRLRSKIVVRRRRKTGGSASLGEEVGTRQWRKVGREVSIELVSRNQATQRLEKRGRDRRGEEQQQ